MKKSKSIVDSRRERIFQIMKEKGSVKVDELAIQLQVSELTIRRDLDFFVNKNLAERFYGGASLSKKITDSSSLITNKDNSNFVLHKHAIAKKAAEFIEDGDTIFINTSSTALLLIKYIKNKHVNIITNNGKAILLDYDPHVSIVLTGGELRVPKESMTGEFALNNLSKVTATKSFIGVSGITAQSGITTAILPEVAINEIMITRALGPVYILADNSKIGKESAFVSGRIDQLSYLITDVDANPDALAQLEEKGLSVITVAPLKQLD